MYQLIAFDMDGTLLTSQQTISTVSLKAIDQAIQAKKQVVLATGRHKALPSRLSFLTICYFRKWSSDL